MKKLMTVLMVLAIGVAFYEQSKQKPNVFIMAAAIVIFMYGVMRLSAKIPGKKDEDVQ
jgi:hypothetical protein